MNKEKIKKIIKNDKFTFVIFVIILILLHIVMRKHADDLIFSQVCNDTSLCEYLKSRYFNWTSRLVIETTEVVFCGYLPMFVWKIINIGMYILLYYSISTIFIKKEDKTTKNLLKILLLCFPILTVMGAGWMSTMNNYLWVLATGIYAMIPIKKILKNEKIKIGESITFLLATIYATNQEQMSGIMFLTYSYFMIEFIRTKKLKITTIIIYLISIASLIIILTCPGNEVRKELEIERWYPEFANQTIIQKIENGIASMMDYAVHKTRIIYCIFIGLIGYTAVKSKDTKLKKIIGLSPIAITLGYNILFSVLEDVKRTEFLNGNLFLLFKTIVYAVLIILIGVSLYQLMCKNKEKSLILRYLPIIIYFIGIVSRLVIAFSPTIYASEERTSMFLYASMIILIIMLFKQNKLNEKFNAK